MTACLWVNNNDFYFYKHGALLYFNENILQSNIIRFGYVEKCSVKFLMLLSGGCLWLTPALNKTLNFYVVI